MSDEKSNVSLASLTNDEVGNLLYEAVKNDDTTQFDSIISALTSEASLTTTTDTSAAVKNYLVNLAATKQNPKQKKKENQNNMM